MCLEGRYARLWAQDDQLLKGEEPPAHVRPAVPENLDSNQTLFERNTTHRLRKKNQNSRGIVIAWSTKLVGKSRFWVRHTA
jgi:hypothetical protein